MTPTVPLIVHRADEYSTAGEVFGQMGADGVTTHSALVSVLAAYAGMAGSDSAGEEWARGYDEAAQLAISTSSKLTTAAGQTRDIIITGAHNHQVGEAGAHVTNQPAPPPPPLSTDPCLPENVASAAGDGIPEPFGWSIVKTMVGFTWPNGHQDQLLAAQTAWHTAAADYRTIAGQAPTAVDLLNNQQSPEIEIAVNSCQARQADFNALADACQTLGDACGNYAHHLDEAHHKILDELKDLLIETAAAEAAFAILAPFTATASEWIGNAALVGPIAIRARRITTVIGELATKVTQLITTFVRPVAERLRPLFNKVRDWVNAAKIKISPFAGREAVLADGQLFSRMGPRTNREILESGDHLPMTQETIEEFARRAGVDLKGVRIDIAASADDVRYFDHMQASASTAPEHIALAPSAFADEQTLLRNLVHERVHIDQYRQGRVGTGVTRELEDEAYAADEQFWQQYLAQNGG